MSRCTLPPDPELRSRLTLDSATRRMLARGVRAGRPHRPRLTAIVHFKKGRATYCQAGELGPTLSGVRRPPRGATTTRTIEVAYCPATAAAAKRADRTPSLSRAREPRRAAPLLVGFAAELDAITSALSRSVPRCPSPSSSSSSSSGSTVRGQALGLAPRSRVQPGEPGPHRPLRNLLRPFLWAVANSLGGRIPPRLGAPPVTPLATVSDRSDGERRETRRAPPRPSPLSLIGGQASALF